MATSNAPGLENIRDMLTQREAATLSPYATPSAGAVRRQSDNRTESDYRSPFSVDTDRILHSRAYTRYIDKTQVFYLVNNDHITHRVLHVQLVAKIARTIGRCLGLNEDLIEAIALGHDIGHPPFGHEGEHFLSKLCQRHGIGAFHHNVQSIQFLDQVEQRGCGWNLCLQTLDGILCHDGETHDRRLIPAPIIDFSAFDVCIQAKKWAAGTQLIPMTLEGCVMRMADTISYIGRDIDDAIRLGLIRREALPSESVEVLGNTNGTIVYHLVTDLILNSLNKPYILFSSKVSKALVALKKFNYRHIYLNPTLKKRKQSIASLFEMLFEQYLNDLKKEKNESVIFTEFLSGMSAHYKETHCHAEIVRDFIAGMTDRYFLRQFPQKMRPQPLLL